MDISYRNQSRIWNGWGNKNQKVFYDKKNELKNFLESRLGKSYSHKEISREEIKKMIHPRVQIQKPYIYQNLDIIIDYSFGQSFSDWIRFKMGYNLRFTDAVAIPSTIEELRELLNISREMDYKIIIYGGGTSVVGHITPESEKPVITVSMEKFNRVLNINQENLSALIQAGANGTEIETQLGQYGFRLGHYPQSFEFSTLGGWIASRSSGQQSLYYGRIEDLFLGGKLITYEGIFEVPPIPASSAALDLKHFILGSEGRIGILYEATVKIRKIPEKEEFLGLFFSNFEEAIQFIREVLQIKTSLSMIRMSFPEESLIHLEMAKYTGNKKIIEYLMKFLNIKGFKEHQFAMMILGFTGLKEEVSDAKKKVISLAKRFKIFYEPYLIAKKLGHSWEKNRFLNPYLRNILWDAGYGVDTLETCISWDKVSFLKRKIEEAIIEAADKYKEKVIVYTHISHIYLNGSSLYTTYIFRNKEDPEENYNFWKEMKTSASKVIVESGGTISHQHGVGKDHKEYLIYEKQKMGLNIIKTLIEKFDPYQILDNKNIIDQEN